MPVHAHNTGTAGGEGMRNALLLQSPVLISSIRRNGRYSTSAMFTATVTDKRMSMTSQ